MNTHKRLLQEALAAAMDVRNRTNRDILQPICIFDVCAELDVEVRFLSLPSLEGMYAAGASPTIVIGAQRPAGRRAYTCAHELAHHEFGHGTRVDLLSEAEGTREFVAEEFIAQAFAGFLLMPRLAVLHALRNRGLHVRTATPRDFFKVARFFGVGYSTLIHHLKGIGLMEDSRAGKLLKVKLSQIRRELVPGAQIDALLPIDLAWTGRAIDTEVGELLLAPPHVSVEGKNLAPITHPTAQLFRAVCPGQCRLIDTQSEWAAFVRVARHEYEGRSAWRHLPEVDDELI